MSWMCFVQLQEFSLLSLGVVKKYLIKALGSSYIALLLIHCTQWILLNKLHPKAIPSTEMNCVLCLQITDTKCLFLWCKLMGEASYQQQGNGSIKDLNPGCETCRTENSINWQHLNIRPKRLKKAWSLQWKLLLLQLEKSQQIRIRCIGVTCVTAEKTALALRLADTTPEN